MNSCHVFTFFHSSGNFIFQYYVQNYMKHKHFQKNARKIAIAKNKKMQEGHLYLSLK